MWRQVLSKSPATDSTDVASAQQTDEYLESWKALGALLHNGRSLSGHERNCCFLNTGQTRFADVSAVTGLDHDADSRALAAVDWDGDGDLDLWVTNRTRPRIRYLQNDSRGDSQFLAVKLRGVTCNRDAIGARVTVSLSGDDRVLVRSLTAGEGFLSQSSKWLHFGLGPSAKIEMVRVQWPGGETQTFTGFQANHRYLLTQGRHQVEIWRKTVASAPLAARALAPAPLSGTKRIVPSQRLPIPEITFRRFDGTQRPAIRLGSPTVINLWASWCRPCIAELSAWKDAAEEFKKAGVYVVLLNVDHAQTEISRQHLEEVNEFLVRFGLPFDGGLIGRENAELVEIVEQTLLLRQHVLPIPSSLLLDRLGRLAILYEGPVATAQLMADIGDLNVASSDSRNHAVPFPGRWLTSPFPPDLLAIPDRLLGFQRGNAAYQYLKSHVLSRNIRNKPDAWQEYGVKTDRIVGILGQTSQLILAQGNAEGAIELLEHAILYSPKDWNVHVRLAQLLMLRKRSSDAIHVSQRMTQLRPQHPLPWNNIAWVLATASDAKVRNPKRAIRIAERICRATKEQEPTPLDTLAVAYASDGRFADAIVAGQKALQLAQSVNRDDLAKTIRERVKLFQKNQPFPPPARHR